MPPLPAAGAAASRPAKTSGAAIASLVLGILSCGFSCLTGIPAIVCGAIGLNRIAKSRQAPFGPVLSGQGLAVTGLVLGSLGTVTAPILVGLLLPAVQSAREAARRTQCMNNVRILAQGMAIAETSSRQLPAAIVDEQGRPLLSWRVAILPYIEEQALYSQFHLDEPWDSEHNRTLIPKMPTVYLCPSTPADREDGETTYLAAAGPGMALDKPSAPAAPPGAKKGARIAGVNPAIFTDGRSKTILVVEVAPEDAVPWTKPEDFECAPAEAHEQLFRGAAHAGRIHIAVFGDTHSEPLTPDEDPQRLAALFTRAGGESITFD